MMELKKLLTVSNKILFLFFLTIAIGVFSLIMWGNHDLQNAYNLYKNHPDINYIPFYSSYNFITYIFIAVLFLDLFLFLAILSVKPYGDSCRNNPITESFIIALSVNNIICALILFSISTFVFIMPAYVFILIIVYSLIIGFLFARARKAVIQYKSNDKYSSKYLEVMDSYFSRKNFTYFPVVFLISWFFSYFAPSFNVFFLHIPADNITILNYIGIVIGLAGIIYFFIARHYKMKRLDELQRLIQLERSSLFNNCSLGLIFLFVVLSNNLHFKIDLADVWFVFILIPSFASDFVENKYK